VKPECVITTEPIIGPKINPICIIATRILRLKDTKVGEETLYMVEFIIGIPIPSPSPKRTAEANTILGDSAVNRV